MQSNMGTQVGCLIMCLLQSSRIDYFTVVLGRASGSQHTEHYGDEGRLPHNLLASECFYHFFLPISLYADCNRNQ